MKHLQCEYYYANFYGSDEEVLTCCMFRLWGPGQAGRGEERRLQEQQQGGQQGQHPAPIRHRSHWLLQGAGMKYKIYEGFL